MNKKEIHLRLGLERSSTATEALETITSLLEKYGQGGPCSKNDQGFVYHNSYLIADNSCAWVLETCGKHWAAEHITSKICFNVILNSSLCVLSCYAITGGFRNISNILTITTKIDRKSDGLEEYAKSKGLWDGQVCFYSY